MSDGVSAAEIGASHTPQSENKEKQFRAAEKLGTNLLQIIASEQKRPLPAFYFSLDKFTQSRFKDILSPQQGKPNPEKATRASLELLFEVCDYLSADTMENYINNKFLSKHSRKEDKQLTYELTQLVKTGVEFYKQVRAENPQLVDVAQREFVARNGLGNSLKTSQDRNAYTKGICEMALSHLPVFNVEGITGPKLFSMAVENDMDKKRIRELDVLSSLSTNNEKIRKPLPGIARKFRGIKDVMHRSKTPSLQPATAKTQ